MTADTRPLKRDLLAAIAAADTPEALEAVRVAAMGKSGSVTALLKTLGGMTPEQRQVEGPKLNGLREAVTAALAAAQDRAGNRGAQRPAGGRAAGHDPARRRRRRRAASTRFRQVMDELAEIFADLGFAVVAGPEIEDDWHNFTALNMPESHPARAMHDTFYFPQAAGDGSGRCCCAPTPRRCRSAR